MSGSESHPDWNELAALAETGPGQARPELMAHLAVCPACLAAYSDAVRTIDLELAGAIPAARPELPRQRAKVVPLRPRWRPAALGAGGLAAAAVLLVVLMSGDPATYGPGDPRAELQTSMTEMSGDGPVYPGVSRLPVDSGTRYRSSGSTASADADALLEPWSQRFATDPADSDAAYWLSAGYLTAGRLQFAEDVLRRALQSHPDATGLLHMEAITAYRRNELDRAEASLERILSQRPGDDLARFNLALIQYETGRGEKARPVLERLAANDDSPALQDRARELLQLMD